MLDSEPPRPPSSLLCIYGDPVTVLDKQDFDFRPHTNSYTSRGVSQNVSNENADPRRVQSALVQGVISSDIKERLGGKLARPNKPRHLSPQREYHNTNVSAFAPAPTPASNVRGLRAHIPPQQVLLPENMPVPQRSLPNPDLMRPMEGDEQGIMGNSVGWVGTAPKNTWSMNASIVRGDADSFLSQNSNLMNTPRILELDINRMMIGQNNISSKIAYNSITDDRLVNASQNNLRSYITVNRPAANQNRPVSYPNNSTNVVKDAPPASPASQTTKRVRMSEVEMSRNMTNTPPLPPISVVTPGLTHSTAEPPRSPPGSSMRQSPPHVQEMITPIK